MKLKNKLIAALGLLSVSVGAFATGPYDTLTAAVDFDDVTGAVMTAAAALIGVYVVIKGVKFVIGFARGG